MLKCETWVYRGQQSRLIQAGNEVPQGWTDAPEVPYAAEGEWDYVIEEKHTPKAKSDEQESTKRGPGRPPKPVEAPETIQD